MAFSQQSYTGQGIVQPTERSRVGEFLGEGLAGLGAGIGQGIEKFAQRKEEMKKREQFKKGTITALTALGADADLLKGMEATELAAYAQMYPQISEGKFYSELTEARQKRDVPVDFAPQIDAAEARLQRAQEESIFRPEFKFTADKFTDSVSDSEAGRSLAESEARALERFSLPSSAVNAFAPYGAGAMPRQTQAPLPGTARSPEIVAREEMQAMRRYAAPVQTYQPAPSRAQGPLGPEAMPGPSETVVKAAKDLDAIRIQAAEGDTRSETYQEMMRRVSETIPELAEKYPTQAKNLYEMLYPKQDKLTPSEQISMMKLQREVQASEVAGYGVAPSVQIAQDFREFAIPTGEGIEKIQELIDIAKQGLAGKLSPENRQRATSIQKRLMGELKEQIVGAGAVSEGEWQILAAVIPDVTKIMSFSDVNIKVLKELQSDLKGKLENRANAISWSPLQGGSVAGQQRPSGKRVSYGMSGQPELQ
jgi:hypothetical protein